MERDLGTATDVSSGFPGGDMTDEARGQRLWPMSPAQEGMFFQTIAQPGSGCYVEQVVCRLNEPLDVDRFLQCWQTVIDRYSVLRTVFHQDDAPEPGQFIQDRAELPFQILDWRGQGRDDQATLLDQHLVADRVRGFDLREAPMMRLVLFRLDNRRQIVLWTLHHIIADGRSMSLLLREVFDRYDSAAPARADHDPEPIPFGAYAAWLRGEGVDAPRAFWKQHLAGIFEATTLPLLPPGEGAVRPAGRTCRVLEPAQSAALYAFAEHHGLTANILLLGAWALLAHRYADSPDVLIGATKAVRHGAAASPDAIGPFINTLPIRTSLDGLTTTLDWLKSLREQWLSLREVEHSPTDLIRECCEIPGDVPLFQMHYVFERATLGDSLRALGGAWASRDVTLHEHTPVPLMLAGYGGESIRIFLEYDGRCFAHADMDRLMDHLVHLLGAIMATPEAPASRLPLVPHSSLVESICQARPEVLPPMASMTPATFEAVVSRTPSAIALRYKDRTITYAEFNIRANQLARCLRGLGVGAGERVGMCLPHTPESMIALLGILKAGGVYVPMDPAYPVERLAYTLEDCGAAVVIVNSETRKQFGEVDKKFVVLSGESNPLGRYSGENLGIPLAPDDLAYIIYTSGSTGRPKGVCVAHGEAALHFELMRDIYRIQTSDRTLQFASLSFDVSLEQIFAPLFAGSILHIADESMYDAADFSSVLREAGITVLNLPPAFWQQWTDEGIARGHDHFGRQFRLLIVGGDVVLPKTVRQWQSYPATDGVLLMNAYGPTETVITALYYEVPSDFDQDLSRDRLPIGKPIRGTEIAVLDRSRNLVPPGLPGELYIGGNRLARGYHNRPELTAQFFIPHPLAPDSGALLYRTGDRVRQLPDGMIEFLGRLDNQVKIRGFRIELGEIEAALLHCAGVREAAVRRRESRSGEAQLAAYIVPEQGVSLDSKHLRASLRTTLPDYMVPAGFVLLDAFPLTVNGKVDYRALPDLDEHSLAPRREYVPPATHTHRVLASIWRDILECGDVGIEDSFFDLGGHSLRAARVITRIRAQLGAQVALGDLLQAPTIASLAELIDGADTTVPKPVPRDPCVVTMQAGGDAPPLFCVLGAGGVLSAYGPLSSHLGAARPILGLQYSHLPEFRSFSTVELVAQRYLIALKSCQPEGPYYLAGWSFGGLVAYEMARCLRENGEALALLAIIDCEARVPAPRSWRSSTATVKHGLLRLVNRGRIIFNTRDLLRYHASDIIRLAGRTLVGRRKDGASLSEYLQFVRSSLHNAHALKQAGLQPAETGASRLDVMADEFVKKVVAGLRANEQAAKVFKMKPYGGTVTLFRTKETPGGFGKSDQTLGYGQLAGSVDVSVIDANHFTLVKEPSVRLLAEALKARLSEMGKS